MGQNNGTADGGRVFLFFFRMCAVARTVQGGVTVLFECRGSVLVLLLNAVMANTGREPFESPGGGDVWSPKYKIRVRPSRNLEGLGKKSQRKRKFALVLKFRYLYSLFMSGLFFNLEFKKGKAAIV
jgi:hypothetical protein